MPSKVVRRVLPLHHLRTTAEHIFLSSRVTLPAVALSIARCDHFLLVMVASVEALKAVAGEGGQPRHCRRAAVSYCNVLSYCLFHAGGAVGCDCPVEDQAPPADH